MQIRPLHDVGNFISHNGAKQPLLVIDFQVICYLMVAHSDSGESDSVLLSRFIAYLNHLPTQFFPTGLYTSAAMLVVNDYKLTEEKDGKAGYWRHNFYADYKKGRAPKPPLLFSIRELALSYVLSSNNPIHYMEFPGYEADDIAGAIVKAKRHAQLMSGYSTCNENFEHRRLAQIADRPIILITVDKDWLQLVGDGVIWCDTGKYNPPVAYELEAVQWAFRRHKWVIEHPHDIVGMKSIYGDASDSLPPGTDPALIDLCNPPKDYCLYSAMPGRFEQELLNYDNAINLAHKEKALKYLVLQGAKIVL